MLVFGGCIIIFWFDFFRDLILGILFGRAWGDDFLGWISSMMFRSILQLVYCSIDPETKVCKKTLLSYVLGSKLPLFPYNRGWSSTQ